MLWAIVFWWDQQGPESGQLLMVWEDSARAAVVGALKKRGATVREQPVPDQHGAEEFQAAVRARVIR